MNDNSLMINDEGPDSFFVTRNSVSPIVPPIPRFHDLFSSPEFNIEDADDVKVIEVSDIGLEDDENGVVMLFDVALEDPQ